MNYGHPAMLQGTQWTPRLTVWWCALVHSKQVCCGQGADMIDRGLCGVIYKDIQAGNS